HERYGSPDHLRLAEVDRPTAGEGQVLVRVVAASVNAGDWRRVRARPWLVRTAEGWRRPKSPLFGADAAGVVEGVGVGAMDLHVGDEVMGIRTGAFAEYVAGANFVPKPRNASFQQAAAVPIAGVTALQALRDHGGLQAGQRVLINGAGGGVGSFAVQIARAMGAEVTAVTSADNLEQLRSLGAHHVIDYAREDATQGGSYDLVVDTGGTPSIGRLREALAPEGTLVLVAAAKGGVGVLGRIAAGAFRGRVLKQRVRFFIADVSKADLLSLKELIEAGKLRPCIDRTYPLAETGAALRYLETGHAHGKVVITI
ncbi:MAG TPA: NAD(P)-dependent alcohol dehydrogenase, partial [Candidatus Limnocylindria bacterium]|nr:NAD(P)-dependent alcohol dehydrogenase [Candidatus Limnocylindria bacterium]